MVRDYDLGSLDRKAKERINERLENVLGDYIHAGKRIATDEGKIPPEAAIEILESVTQTANRAWYGFYDLEWAKGILEGRMPKALGVGPDTPHLSQRSASIAYNLLKDLDQLSDDEQHKRISAINRIMQGDVSVESIDGQLKVERQVNELRSQLHDSERDKHDAEQRRRTSEHERRLANQKLIRLEEILEATETQDVDELQQYILRLRQNQGYPSDRQLQQENDQLRQQVAQLEQAIRGDATPYQEQLKQLREAKEKAENIIESVKGAKRDYAPLASRRSIIYIDKSALSDEARQSLDVVKQSGSQKEGD